MDLVSRELHREDQKINLQEKPFQVLAILLEQPGELVTREDLRRRLWPEDTFVDFDHGINTAIKKVREALEDSGDHPKFVETLPRRGYRFIATVEIVGAAAAGPNHAIAETPRPVESWSRLAEVPVLDRQHPGRETSLRSSDLRERRAQSLWSAIPHRWTVVGMGVLILVVLAVFATGSWYRHSQRAIPSIAVLPFADLSPGHDHEYFSEGLAEEILNHLTKIPNLKVTARASAFQFKGTHEDSRVVGQKLDVADILEGSVQREKDRVRVAVRLIKADDGFNLWSESFDRELKDIFAVEDDIARAVTSALQIKLLESRSPTTLTTSGTTNPEAYEAFLHARYFAYMDDQESARKAVDYASRAIGLDPKYARAYALRADIELVSGTLAWADLSEAAEKARRDTEKTIALDPNLADGYRVLSTIQAWLELNCPEAETSLKRAIDLAPRDPDSLGRSGMLAMCQGRLEEAVGLWKQELLLDPLRPEEYLWLAQSLRDLGRYEEAHVELAKALDLNPNQMMIHEVRGEVYLAQGRLQEALAEMEKESQISYRDLGEALAFHALGRRQESDAALGRVISQHANDQAYQIGQAYAYRGERERAFEWLNRAFAQHDAGLMWFKTDLKLQSLRKDPRYGDLLKKLHLPE